MKKILTCLVICLFVFFSKPSSASIVIVPSNSLHDVKIAFVSNTQSADCFLLSSHFTKNYQFAQIKAAIVNFQLADKRVMIISNTMNADNPSCLLGF